MPVGDVHQDHAARRQPRQIAAQRLAREQVHRDRVGGERIEHDQVELLRRRGKRQPRIAEHDRRRGAQLGQEAEHARIAREPHHFRIDLEEGPALAVVPMAGEAAGPEPDDRDVLQAALRGARRRDAFRDRPAEIVIGERLGPAGDRRAVGLAHALRAVDRGAVIAGCDACRSRSRPPDARRRSCASSRSTARPGCQTPVTMKATTASAAKRAVSRRCSSIRPTSATSATWNGSAAFSLQAHVDDERQQDRERRERRAPARCATGSCARCR